ncbi:peroxiredoxin family protein [Methylolobus aquaticus]
MPTDYPSAPPLDVSHWFNTSEPLSLAALHGRVVVLHAFQMLCPGCVSHGLPQAQAVHDHFHPHGVTVIGLHTVFEHHEAMTPVALKAFIHEYRLRFPIGVDRPATTGVIPHTMRAYHLEGTPSLVVIDRTGRIRETAFGHVEDLRLGALLGSLLSETPATLVAGPEGAARRDEPGSCDEGTCRSP